MTTKKLRMSVLFPSPRNHKQTQGHTHSTTVSHIAKKPEQTLPSSWSNCINTQPKNKTRGKQNVYKEITDELYGDCQYGNYIETRNATVGNGFVEFTKHFKYLGSFVSYNLKDDYDIGQQLTNAYQHMGALKSFWDNQRIELYSKCLILLQIEISE